jgi:hypothetical protein
MNQVTVTASNLGHVITPSENNPEFGYVRVEETKVSYEGKFRNEKTRSATIWGKVADLKKDGFFAGQKINGQIVIKESLDPTNPNNLEQDLKKAGDTGVVCSQDGQGIYRTSVFTADLDAKDTLIAHDNADQIKAAQATKMVAIGDNLITA